jgi:hypothetical protein
MTKTGDEAVDSMFDEFNAVSVRAVNGRRFVAGEETIREMEFAEACEEFVAAKRKWEKIDRRAKAQVGVPDNLCYWFDALEARYQPDKRLWPLFVGKDRSSNQTAVEDTSDSVCSRFGTSLERLAQESKCLSRLALRNVLVCATFESHRRA